MHSEHTPLYLPFYEVTVESSVLHDAELYRVRLGNGEMVVVLNELDGENGAMRAQHTLLLTLDERQTLG